jgi:hypothetical protein
MEHFSALQPSPIQPGTAHDRPYSLMSGFRALASSMSHHSSAKEGVGWGWVGAAVSSWVATEEHWAETVHGGGRTAAFVVEVVAGVHVARLRRLGGLPVAPDPAANGGASQSARQQAGSRQVAAGFRRQGAGQGPHSTFRICTLPPFFGENSASSTWPR